MRDESRARTIPGVPQRGPPLLLPAKGLRYDVPGEGPTLVLVHRRQAWDPVLDLLTPYRRVVTVDRPGHGESEDLDVFGAERLGDRAPALFRSRLVRYTSLLPFFAHPSRVPYEAAVVDMQSLLTNTTLACREGLTASTETGEFVSSR